MVIKQFPFGLSPILMSFATDSQTLRCPGLEPKSFVIKQMN